MVKSATATGKSHKREPHRDRSMLPRSEQERRKWIAEAAYYKAERRNFVPGYENYDWYEAEQEVDGSLRDR